MPPEPAERFDHFMARANATYYATHNPFTNFTTAPELTQVFGELLGGWAKIVSQMLGTSTAPMLVEAGAGRGVMMADMLRAFGPTHPPVHFIETSPALRAAQAACVPHATWHESLATLPPGPIILLANEFLDALPIRQFIRTPNGWAEHYVANDQLIAQLIAHPIPLPESLQHEDAPEGTILELNEPALNFITQLATRNAVALFIDYGPATAQFGNSVQAIHNQKYAPPLSNPGQADITAHVNFTALAQAARKAGGAVQGPVKQNAFLTALGLMQRTAQLAERHPENAENLRLAAHRLTAPQAMGSLFKAFALCPPGFPPLPGFET